MSNKEKNREKNKERSKNKEKNKNKEKSKTKEKIRSRGITKPNTNSTTKSNTNSTTKSNTNSTTKSNTNSTTKSNTSINKRKNNHQTHPKHPKTAPTPRKRTPPPLPHLTATESLIAQHGTIKDYLDLLTLKYLKTGDTVFVNELIECASVQRNDNIYYALCNLADIVNDREDGNGREYDREGGSSREGSNGSSREDGNGKNSNNDTNSSTGKNSNSSNITNTNNTNTIPINTNTIPINTNTIPINTNITNFFRLAMKNTFITSKSTLITASILPKIPALLIPFILKIRNKDTYRVVTDALLGMRYDRTVDHELMDMFFKEDDWLVRMRIVYVMVGRCADEEIMMIYKFMVGVNERYGLSHDYGCNRDGNRDDGCSGSTITRPTTSLDIRSTTSLNTKPNTRPIAKPNTSLNTRPTKSNTKPNTKINDQLKPRDKTLITKINDMLINHLSKTAPTLPINQSPSTHNFPKLLALSSNKHNLINTYLNECIPSAHNLSLILDYVLESRDGKILVRVIECGLDDEGVRCFVERMRDVVVEKDVLYYVVGMKRHWDESVRRCVDGILKDRMGKVR